MNTLQNIIKEGEKEFDEKFINRIDVLTRWGKRIKNRRLKANLKENDLKPFLSSRTTAGYRAGIEEAIEVVESALDIGALAAGTPQAMEHNRGWENCKHHVSSALKTLIK